MTALSAPSWSGASASVPDERPTRDTRAVRACTVIALLSTTVLARFGANVGGESLPISLAALYVLVAALAHCSPHSMQQGRGREVHPADYGRIRRAGQGFLDSPLRRCYPVSGGSESWLPRRQRLLGGLCACVYR